VRKSRCETLAAVVLRPTGHIVHTGPVLLISRREVSCDRYTRNITIIIINIVVRLTLAFVSRFDKPTDGDRARRRPIWFRRRHILVSRSLISRATGVRRETRVRRPRFRFVSSTYDQGGEGPFKSNNWIFIFIECTIFITAPGGYSRILHTSYIYIASSGRQEERRKTYRGKERERELYSTLNERR